MASAQNSIQDPQTKVVQHNHIIIKYQQPPDPAIINHVLELLIENYEKLFQKESSTDTIYPRLYRSNNSIITNSYSQSAQQVLEQDGVPPPASNTIYLPPTLQRFATTS